MKGLVVSVIAGKPIDLMRVIKFKKSRLRVRYELQEMDLPTM